MKGVNFTNDATSTSSVCHIEYLSEDLKNEIKIQLAKICEGAQKTGSNNSGNYTYKPTLKIFLQRYDKKARETKIGMIGELLSHIIIPHKINQLKHASTYFNLEEDGIKKSFDVIFFEKTNKKIWITEVKSGENHKNNSNSANKALLNNAKNDLKKRLNSNNFSFWNNAVNGAYVALEEDKGKAKNKIKKKIISILDEMKNESYVENSTSKNKNVILISVLFENINTPISIDSIKEKYKSIENENIFNNHILFSIQKNTYSKIASFLKSESENDDY